MVDLNALRGAIFREYRNITEFCGAADVPRATMDALMSGKSSPTLVTLKKIMAALHTLTDEEKYSIFFA